MSCNNKFGALKFRKKCGYSALASFNPLRYRGYVYDEETGLYYLQSRYYDPETGRFISADAYLVAGDHINSTNMFAYCLNNPVMYVDPSGCSSETVSNNDLIGAALFLIKISQIISSFFNYFKIHPVVDISDRLDEEMMLHANELATYRDENGYVEACLFFEKNVRNNGEWDIKRNPDWNLNKNAIYIYHGIVLRYDDIGNIHYGYVGRVLFSEQVLLTAAGMYQAKDDYENYGEFKWSITSRFDDPRDQWAIRYGYHLWDKGI